MHKYLALGLFALSTCFVATTVASEVIIGGEEARPHEYSYTVSIQLAHGVNECVGSVIGDQFILTAAHCLVDRYGDFHRRPMFVVAGTRDLRRTYQPAMTISVRKVYMPVEFDFRAPFTIGDIAVLKLNRTLRLTENQYIKKLKLPQSEDDSSYLNDIVTVTGFGYDVVHVLSGQEQFGIGEPVLRYAEAFVISNGFCQRAYDQLLIHGSHVCAKIHQHPLAPNQTEPLHLRRGICYKDSGAPLVLNGTTIIGILSRGDAYCSERIKPGIYTRVTRFMKFINDAEKDKNTVVLRSYQYF